MAGAAARSPEVEAEAGVQLAMLPLVRHLALLLYASGAAAIAALAVAFRLRLR